MKKQIIINPPIKKQPMQRHIIKKGWVELGIIILLWTIFWFIGLKLLNNSNIIIRTLLIIGYCFLINYALITIVYWTVKKLNKEWEIRN